MEPDTSQWGSVTGLEKVGTTETQKRLLKPKTRKYSVPGWSSVATGCPERLWRYSKPD